MSAASPTDLFGTNERRAKIRYHRLARTLHPDNGGSEEAMARLNALWAEYNGKGEASNDVGKKPAEVTRDETYAVFDENGWMVVERHTGKAKAPKDLKALYEIFDGSPVCMLIHKKSILIAQSDGNHAAYTCEPPDTITDGRKAIMLPSLAHRLPDGTIHPADLAWVTKRILFLAAALEKVGLTFDNDASECLAVAPDTHMLVVMTPWELVESDKPTERQLVKSYKACVEGMVSGPKGQRIMRFLDGVVIDSYTPSVRILEEYDDVLYGLFGPPRFHEMQTV